MKGGSGLLYSIFDYSTVRHQVFRILNDGKNMMKKHERLARRLGWGDLDEAFLTDLIARARDEDLAGAGLGHPPVVAGDPSSRGLRNTGEGVARIVARENLVACGLPLLPLILSAYGSEARVTPRVSDGESVTAGTALAELRGQRSDLLTAERVMLNFLQHLSGIATHTATFVAALEGSSTRLLDTRKTTPGFRVLEKYAVACGGGWNHRIGLFDRVMIKDNHLAAGRTVNGEQLARFVIETARDNPGLPIEVEVDSLQQIPPVLSAKPDVILLDNFSLEDLRQAVTLIGGKCATEASGGVTRENLPELGRLGLTFISCGALTHQSRWRDIALDWDTP